MMSGMDVGTRVQLLKKYDKDGDGRLDKKERAEAMKAIKGKVADLEEIKAKHAEHVIKKFDADGDGQLNDEERLKLTQDPEIQNMFKRMLNTNRTPRGGGDNPPPPPPPPND